MTNVQIKVGDRVPFQRDVDGPVEQRQVRGFLHYPEPPTPGTLVGPNGWGEICVVLGTWRRSTAIGLATSPDVAEAVVRGISGIPDSTVDRMSRRALAMAQAQRVAALTKMVGKR